MLKSKGIIAIETVKYFPHLRQKETEAFISNISNVANELGLEQISGRMLFSPFVSSDFSIEIGSQLRRSRDENDVMDDVLFFASKC
jgi:hypothetical protein